jgi:hypothetical protein
MGKTLVFLFSTSESSFCRGFDDYPCHSPQSKNYRRVEQRWIKCLLDSYISRLDFFG